jgi:hypothetical protein
MALVEGDLAQGLELACEAVPVRDGGGVSFRSLLA